MRIRINALHILAVCCTLFISCNKKESKSDPKFSILGNHLIDICYSNPESKGCEAAEGQCPGGLELGETRLVDNACYYDGICREYSCIENEEGIPVLVQNSSGGNM